MGTSPLKTPKTRWSPKIFAVNRNAREAGRTRWLINSKAIIKLVVLYPINETYIILFNFNNNNKMIQSDKLVF